MARGEHNRLDLCKVSGTVGITTKMLYYEPAAHSTIKCYFILSIMHYRGYDWARQGRRNLGTGFEQVILVSILPNRGKFT